MARRDKDATMAERPGGGRRRSRRDSADTASSIRGTPPTSKDRRTKRSGKPVKERWLLTRKTWRYMADAGRRLIPDGTHNRPEDIPKIEQYFQEVCQKEPRFLLWRKASYPGSLNFRAQRRRKQIKGGSCRTQAGSADEADDVRSSPQSFVLCATKSGKFDLTKATREWLLTSDGSNDGGGDGGSGIGDDSTPSSPVARRKTPQEDAEAKELADMLQKYLNMQGDAVDPRMAIESQGTAEQMEGKEPFDYRSLIDKLQQHLNTIVAQAKREKVSPSTQSTSSEKNLVPASMLPYQGDYVHKSLMETLSRYYSKSSSREHVISDILTDRKLLEKLYFDLRCTRGFRGPRVTGTYSSPSTRWWAHERNRAPIEESSNRSPRRDPISPPPLIAVQEPSTDRSFLDNGVQTDPISQDVLDSCLLEKEKEELPQKEQISHKSSGRRRSSVDNDDVSPSVSDTIKRYLRMARKKSIDADKIDRFKRVNYDRNLRNIKAKGEITKPGDDDGNNKGCQTEDNWVVHYREISSFGSGEVPSENLSDADTTTSPPVSRNASSRSSIDAGLGFEETSSTPIKHPHHHQSFLSHLLHGSNSHKDKPHSAPGSPALTSSSTNSAGGTAMQKSKSSSSVVHHGSRLVAKKIWRSRSKSTSRASHQPSVWTPQVSLF